MIAAVHPQQAGRIEALRSYKILDTPRESDFDDIVKLASAVCDAPISVINLIDVNRQWFKAEVGLGVRETPLDTSLCAHAILEDSFVEIPDTLDDQRMRDNPLCAGEHGLRFYAGALLHTQGGLPIGTLCILDYKPRQLTPLQKQTLLVLGKQVMLQLDLRSALTRQTLLLKEIDHRVKNSLASVASLIRMERRKTESENVEQFLETLEGRVSRIGLLHEQLYRAGDVASIEFRGYLERVGAMLADLNPGNVDISIECGDERGDASLASALGIVVSEFILNSFKHGFPDGRAGTVRIALTRSTDDELLLSCSDNGVGGNSVSSSTDGIGLRLIEAAVAQAGGSSMFRIDGDGSSLTASLPRSTQSRAG